MRLVLSLGLSLVMVALTLIAVLALSSASLRRCIDGRRGVARQHALQQSGWMRVLDPVIRRVAAWLVPMLPSRIEHRIERRLSDAGYALGLGSSEWVALMALSMLGCSLAGALVGLPTGASSLYALVGAVLGPTIPWLRLQSVKLARDRQIAHGLPAAIDLAGLCMAAGLDFAASLELIVEQAPDGKAPLIIELQHLLRALRLGRTRAAALADFAEAVPLPCVIELVAAVRQAERKGTPMSHVLMVQAEMLRHRRGVAAEEAAARAGVLLVLPLLLLMACVMLLLFSPLLINGFGL